MTEIKIIFFGWNNKGIHDKTWGAVQIEESTYTFWGKRTSQIRFKLFSKKELDGWGESNLSNTIRQKTKSGYVSYQNPNEVIPGFEDKLKKCLFVAKICDKVM